MVLVVLGVMLAIAAPNLRDLVVNNRLSTTASDLVVDLTFARATAVQRGVRVGVCRSASGADCDGASWREGWIVYTDAGSDGYTPGTDTILRVHEALAGEMTVTATPDAARILFRPSGPADAARTFRICVAGYVGRDVSISATGRVASAHTPTPCS